MNDLTQKITQVYTLLLEKKIIKHVSLENNFPDEPKMYRYNAFLTSTKKFSDGHPNESVASGFSFFRQDLALLKCLMEGAERFSTMCYRQKNLVVSPFSDLQQPALNPTIFPQAKVTSSSIFQWSKGIHLMTGEEIYIPAQLIYYTYHYLKNEPQLTELNSTGAAGGLERESTILRGIYEIIERDAFMTMYLAQLPCKPIDLGKINNANIKKIVAAAHRYNLEMKVFTITNDLEIPSFLGMVLDKTGLGPFLSLGLKSSLDPLVGIVGCMEEAFHTRPIAKRSLHQQKTNNFQIKPENVNSIKNRSLYWMSPHMLEQVGFLLKQKEYAIKLDKTHLRVASELKRVLRILDQHGFQVYVVDTTLPLLKQSGFYSCKIIIPGLQPLYLREKTKEVRMDRLKNAALSHGVTKVTINPIPHPFL